MWLWRLRSDCCSLPLYLTHCPKKAIFSRKEAPYGLFPTSTMLRDKKLNAYFESKEDMDSAFTLNVVDVCAFVIA